MLSVVHRTGRRVFVPLASAASLSALAGLTVVACDESSVIPIPVQVPGSTAAEKEEAIQGYRESSREFRKGPCGHLWPPVEHCYSRLFKEANHIGASTVDIVECRPFVKMFDECKGLEQSDIKYPDIPDGESKYPALYLLLDMQRKRYGYIDKMEAELTKKSKALPLPWAELQVDWSKVWEYAKSTNFTLDDFGATPIEWKPFLSGYYGQRDLDDYVAGRNVMSKERAIILGDTAEEVPIYDKDAFDACAQDPVLIAVSVRVNLHDDNGAPIALCYARDQTGAVIGFDHFEKELKAGVKDDVLWVYVEPGKTMSVKLYKIYKGEEETAEARIYVSKAKYLVEAAFEAGYE